MDDLHVTGPEEGFVPASSQAIFGEKVQGSGRNHDANAQGAWPEVMEEQDHYEGLEADVHEEEVLQPED